jgi:diguanylate cyclase (GGDEF)-like protein
LHYGRAVDKTVSRLNALPEAVARQPWRRRIPNLIFPAALAATIMATACVARGDFALGGMLAVVATAASVEGHRRGRSRAATAIRERRLSGLHLATIEALALAIDAKDQTTSRHIRRVEWLARALAHAVGVPDEEVQGIATAAVLHDIGKLAVPEHILSKPGPLTDEEFRKVKIHPQVGFEIIEHVPFPYPVAPLVLCHHERWDGTGYPLGLRGEGIPRGARILAVADYFDSVTRDRPYNKRMSGELALLLLRQESGRALDPHLVSVFLELVPTLRFADESLAGPVEHTASGRGWPRRVLKGGEMTAFANIARAHQEIYALYEIAKAIGSSLGVADTMSLIADKLTALVPFSCCALFVAEDDGIVRCRFAAGVDGEDLKRIRLQAGSGHAGWVISHRQSLVNASPAADFEAACLATAAQNLRSSLLCPLVANGQVVGAIALYHVEPGFYSEDHRRLLDRISEQAAAAISNSIVFEQTREASLSDALTGLPNTRYMVSHLARELARAERQGSQVAILVLDLDDFKKINDTHGHHVGDRALREVARVLRETIRPYDVCVRYAGDEFIIVLAGCGPEEAEAKRLELQCAVDTMKFETPAGRPVKMSLSLGAAVYPEDGETYEALLATADGRMYHDKKSRKRPDMRSQLVSLVQPAVDEDFAQEPEVSMAVPPPDVRVN